MSLESNGPDPTELRPGEASTREQNPDKAAHMGEAASDGMNLSKELTQLAAEQSKSTEPWSAEVATDTRQQADMSREAAMRAGEKAGNVYDARQQVAELLPEADKAGVSKEPAAPAS